MHVIYITDNGNFNAYIDINTINHQLTVHCYKHKYIHTTKEITITLKWDPSTNTSPN